MDGLPAGASELARLRAAIPAGCRAISPAKSWFALLRCLALIALCEWLLAVLPRTGAWLAFTPVLWGLLACGLVGLFVIGHDCGHGSFSRTGWVNDAVGHLCMALLLNGFHNWRLGHAHHHRHVAIRGLDTDWHEQLVTAEEFRGLSPAGRLKVILGHGSPVGLLLGFWIGVWRRAFMPRAYPQVRLNRRRRRQCLVSQAAAVAASGAVVAALLAGGGWPMLLRHYAAPLLIAAVLGALITYLHHSGPDAVAFDSGEWTSARGQIASTFEVRFPRWLEWLWLDINLHLPHHVAPEIPWYHLREAGRCLRAACPDAPPERPFRPAYLFRAWRLPLVARKHAAACYVTAPSPFRFRRRNG